MGTAFPDGDTYAAYIGQGGNMTIDDWRRDNVNRMVIMKKDSKTVLTSYHASTG